MKRLLLFLLVAFLLVAGSGRVFAGSAPGPQPVFVYLYASIGDHINIEQSEDRLRRLLPMVERLAKQHPEAHVAATVFFSGAASRALTDRNSQSHIRDLVADAVRRGIIQVGYDGADEPTYKHHALIDYANAKSPADRWQARQTTADRLLTEGRDPLSGDPRPGVSGGLKAMQEVFGPAACIKGILLAVPDLTVTLMPETGADSEVVNAVRHYNTQAIMFGLPDASPVHGPMLRPWDDHYSKEVSPVPETSPEVFWQDNVLRTSESSEADMRLFRASSGIDALKSVMAKLDRSRIRVMHVELANAADYLSPSFKGTALAYAYAHPENPKLPPEAGCPRADVDSAFVKEEAVVQYLADFFAGNAGSHFVSSSGLKEMAQPASGYAVSTAKLRDALEDALRKWDGPTPPEYLWVDGHYLSMADMFQVMTDALAERNRSGKLAESVKVSAIFGPLETTRERGPMSGEVTAASIAATCAGLTARLHDDAWSPVPKNTIPGRVPVNGINLTAAQFLRLMAEAMIAPSLEAKLTVKPIDGFWGHDAIYFRTRSIADMGASWTVKPAVLKSSL